VLREAVHRFPDTIFSIDTTKYEVAKAALELGVHYVNDVSGLRKEPRFPQLCATYGAGLILMHSIGNPKTMQQQPTYHDVVHEVLDFLLNAASRATAAGVTGIILDPGIGFGKTLDHNLALLRATQTFADTGYPILIGASRKSMISTILGERPPDQRLAGTLSIHYHAMMHGATMLRVHDVQEASDSVAIYNALHNHSD
jgi:dihydropteroate synthase